MQNEQEAQGDPGSNENSGRKSVQIFVGIEGMEHYEVLIANKQTWATATILLSTVDTDDSIKEKIQTQLGYTPDYTELFLPCGKPFETSDLPLLLEEKEPTLHVTRPREAERRAGPFKKRLSLPVLEEILRQAHTWS